MQEGRLAAALQSPQRRAVGHQEGISEQHEWRRYLPVAHAVGKVARLLSLHSESLPQPLVEVLKVPPR